MNKMEKLMKVEIHLLDQSKSIKKKKVKNTYQKGDLFCVLLNCGSVEKFPINRIFRITETY